MNASDISVSLTGTVLRGRRQTAPVTAIIRETLLAGILGGVLLGQTRNAAIRRFLLNEDVERLDVIQRDRATEAIGDPLLGQRRLRHRRDSPAFVGQARD